MEFRIIVVTAAALLASGGVMADEACRVRSEPTLLPLVELYTSEGCSSCPPADAWLSSRLGKDRANFLAFHVDYWDDIGWPDRFASATYSQRQRSRVSAAGGRTVYTPQVMVGREVQASWQRDLSWRALLAPARVPARASLALKLEPGSGAPTVTAGAALSAEARDGDAMLWLAEYSDGEQTSVRAGENRGRVLNHDRVVRALHGPWPVGQAGSRRSLPLAAGSAGVVAFVQTASGETLQSLDLSLAQCRR